MRLGKGFVNLEEGQDQVLLISKVAYDEKYAKCKLTFKDEQTGGTGTEQFTFKSGNKVNDVALNIFTTIAMCAMDDFTLREKDFDPELLEGRHVLCDVLMEDVEFEDGGKGRFPKYRNFRVARDVGAQDGEEADEADDAAEDDDDDGLFD